MTFTDESQPVQRSGVSNALSTVNRAIQILVPAYGFGVLGMRNENRYRGANDSRLYNSGFIGVIGGIMLSGALSYVVDHMSYPVVGQARSEHAVYSQQVQTPARDFDIPLKHLSAPIYWVDSLFRERGLVSELEVAVEGATCTYVADGMVPVAELDSFGRPTSITYRGSQVPFDSAVGSAIEQQCATTIDAEHDDLVDSFEFR